MRNAPETLLILVAAAALAACGRDETEQNVVITNTVPPNAEVEALPPDESSTVPTNELINGADDQDVTAADNQTDSY